MMARHPLCMQTRTSAWTVIFYDTNKTHSRNESEKLKARLNEFGKIISIANEEQRFFINNPNLMIQICLALRLFKLIILKRIFQIVFLIMTYVTHFKKYFIPLKYNFSK